MTPAPGAPAGRPDEARRARWPSLTFSVTDDCPAACSYCYRRPRRRAGMSRETARAALDLLLPRLAARPFVSFYGGEPLLEVSLVGEIVAAIEARKRRLGLRPRYGITTSGEGWTPAAAELLARHRFRVTLSFDGPAQEVHRRPGSFGRVSSILDERLATDPVRTSVNAVFTPDSARLLLRSAAWLAGRGVRSLSLSLDLTRPWDPAARRRLAAGMAGVRRLLLRARREGRPLEIAGFEIAPPRGAAACPGAARSIAVAPDGTLWGCSLFADAADRSPRPRGFRRRFSLGNVRRLDSKRLDSALRDALPRYRAVSQPNARVDGVPCAFCPDVEECGACPLVPALPGRPLGAVPRDLCAVQRVLVRARRRFRSDAARGAAGPGAGPQSSSAGSGRTDPVVSKVRPSASRTKR